MFETFRNAWKIEDLRKRLLYTLLILIIFRLGCAVPVPYIDSSALTEMFNTTGSMLTYLNMMSGSALSQCAIFALGVQPYINASIIVQLLCVAIPYLENLSKEGEEGRRKLTRITNYVGAGIGLMLSIAYYFILRRMGALEYTTGFGGISSPDLHRACQFAPAADESCGIAVCHTIQSSHHHGAGFTAFSRRVALSSAGHARAGHCGGLFVVI